MSSGKYRLNCSGPIPSGSRAPFRAEHMPAEAAEAAAGRSLDPGSRAPGRCSPTDSKNRITTISVASPMAATEHHQDELRDRS